MSAMALLKIAALVVFFGGFMFILLRLIFGGRARYEAAARIPLEEDTGNPQTDRGNPAHE